MNQVLLTGKAFKEPELRYSKSGLPIANVTLAVPKDGNPKANAFIRLVAFGEIATKLADNIKAQTTFSAIGEIVTGKYEKNGVTHYTTDVVVWEIGSDAQKVFNTPKPKRDNNNNQNSSF